MLDYYHICFFSEFVGILAFTIVWGSGLEWATGGTRFTRAPEWVFETLPKIFFGGLLVLSLLWVVLDSRAVGSLPGWGIALWGFGVPFVMGIYKFFWRRRKTY